MATNTLGTSMIVLNDYLHGIMPAARLEHELGHSFAVAIWLFSAET